MEKNIKETEKPTRHPANNYIKTKILAEKVIDKTKVQALNKSIENAGITDEVVELILSGYGYTSTSEIKIKDYNSIVQDFKSKKE